MTLEDTIRTVVHEELERALRDVLPEVLAAALKPPAPSRGELLTVADVAKRCRTKPKVVRGWIAQGRLKASRPGHQYLVEPAALERYLSGLVLKKAGPASDNDQVSRIVGSLERRDH